MAYKAYNFRLPDTVNDHLNELSKISGLNRTEFIINAIESAYDSMNGNPKMKSVMQQLQNMRNELFGFGGSES